MTVSLHRDHDLRERSRFPRRVRAGIAQDERARIRSGDRAVTTQEERASIGSGHRALTAPAMPRVALP